MASRLLLRSLTLTGALILAISTGGAAQSFDPIGVEFQVNSYTPNYQAGPAIALDDDGDFVVVWNSNTQDGSSYGVFAQRYDSAGAAQGGELQVNAFTPNNQQGVSVTFQGDVGFVVVWGSYGQDGVDSGFGIFARRYDSTGSALSTDLQVNTFTTGGQSGPAVASAANGDFVVVWSSGQAQDGDGYGIFGQRFDSSGAPQGAEFMVNSYTSSSQYWAVVSRSPGGDFVVAWTSSAQDGSEYGVFAQRFDSAGTRVGGEFQVNTYTQDDQRYPAIAVDDEGDFVVAWGAAGRNGDYFDVLAQRYDSLGTALGVEFLVNGFTDHDQLYPSIGTDASGGFVIVWDSFDRYGSGRNVFGRRFDSAGTAQGIEYPVNSTTFDDQAVPAVAVNAGGALVVAWESASQDGPAHGIFAQRFAGLEAFATLDVDQDGAIGPLTDGLLVLRYLFGFTGSSLTANATGLQCARCDAADISAYLLSIDSVLDVDLDGETEPLTDGLLVLRFMFGFTGPALVNGTVDTGDCTRCEASEIVGYLEPLV